MPYHHNYEEPPEYLDELGKRVVHAAYNVHERWGPGLYEHFYQLALKNELLKSGLEVESEVFVPIRLDDFILKKAYKIDLLVQKEIVIEVKTVEKILEIHRKQIRTYMRLSNHRLGYLINFNCDRIKEGLERVIMSQPK